MRKIILLVVLVTLSWKGYEKYGHDMNQTEATPKRALSTEAEVRDVSDIDIKSSSRSTFTCDGRVYCSQMNSCDEAKYFLEHCPNVKMDGNHDGIPCEKQWCS
jgi:Excalibur calcium-binding domain